MNVIFGITTSNNLIINKIMHEGVAYFSLININFPQLVIVAPPTSFHSTIN